jgi:AcrR family transcriptional regulator
MTTVVTRKYDQRLRAATTEQTRHRILEAVHARLREAPAEPLSVGAVAERAQVSRSTVYLVFGSRAGLFDAVATDLLQRGGFDQLVEAVAHPDAREHLRQGIAASVRMMVVDRDVRRALISMSALDPDTVGGAIEKGEQNRAGGMRHLAQRLHDQGLLHPGLSVDDAAHLLWVLTSFDAFDLLYTGRGLPADEVTRLLVGAAERALLRVPATRKAQRP